jgi:hypothetical protein
LRILTVLNQLLYMYDYIVIIAAGVSIQFIRRFITLI